MKKLFETFNRGQLIIPNKTLNFESVAWSKHPTFDGVELKHIVTSSDTNGEFSYHLVSDLHTNFSAFVSIIISPSTTIPIV